VVVGGVGRGARGGALGSPVGDEAVEAGSQLSPGRRGGEAAIEVGDRGRRPDRRDRVVGQRAGRRGSRPVGRRRRAGSGTPRRRSRRSPTRRRRRLGADAAAGGARGRSRSAATSGQRAAGSAGASARTRTGRTRARQIALACGRFAFGGAARSSSTVSSSGTAAARSGPPTARPRTRTDRRPGRPAGPPNCSGAMYAGVPTIAPVRRQGRSIDRRCLIDWRWWIVPRVVIGAARLDSSAVAGAALDVRARPAASPPARRASKPRARPKSVTTTRPSRPSKTLAGLKSRWTSPRAWAAAKPGAGGAEPAQHLGRGTALGRAATRPGCRLRAAPSRRSRRRRRGADLVAR
jgi:hypothetical protein